MTLTYEVQTDYNTIKATDENGKEFFIPMVAGNADYEEYLNPSAQSKEITTPQGGTE